MYLFSCVFTSCLEGGSKEKNHCRARFGKKIWPGRTDSFLHGEWPLFVTFVQIVFFFYFADTLFRFYNAFVIGLRLFYLIPYICSICLWPRFAREVGYVITLLAYARRCLFCSTVLLLPLSFSFSLASLERGLRVTTLLAHARKDPLCFSASSSSVCKFIYLILIFRPQVKRQDGYCRRGRELSPPHRTQNARDCPIGRAVWAFWALPPPQAAVAAHDGGGGGLAS